GPDRSRLFPGRCSCWWRHPPQPRPGPGVPQLRRHVRADRRARLRRVLRSAGGRLRPRADAGGHPRADPGGSAEHLALRRSAARRPRPGRPGEPRPGPDPAGARRPARRRARAHRWPLGEGRLGQPDALLQGPRRQPRRHRRQGPGLSQDRGCLDGQPGQLGGRARRTRRHPVLRLHPQRPRAGQGRPVGGLRADAGRRRRVLRRRQPADQRARRDRRVRGHRLRQPERPALLRRGLQDDGLRDRRAARLADPGPGRHPHGVRLAAHQGGQGLPGADRRRHRRGDRVDGLRRAVGRVRPDRHCLRAGLGRGEAGEADRHRQVAQHRQPRRRPLRPGRHPAHRRFGRA
ncbi:MAG: Threonine synthase, partial [uncultured Blastococcus sp.]